jgi:hypothetical protein
MIAKMGVFLCFVSFLGAPTIYYTKQFILGRESRVFADRYIDLLLENKLKTAFGLTVSPLLQANSNDDIEKILDRVGRDGYSGYLQTPIVNNLAGRGKSAQVTHMGLWYPGTEQGVDRVLHTYQITLDPSNPNDKPLTWNVSLVLRGATGKEWTGRRWQVESAHPEIHIPKEEKKAKKK